jgi:hypothetical protein
MNTKPESIAALRRHAERPARLQRLARARNDRLAVAVLEGGPRFVDHDDCYVITVLPRHGLRWARAS